LIKKPDVNVWAERAKSWAKIQFQGFVLSARGLTPRLHHEFEHSDEQSQSTEEAGYEPGEQGKSPVHLLEALIYCPKALVHVMYQVFEALIHHPKALIYVVY